MRSLLTALVAAALAGSSQAEDVVRLRPVRPKAVYRPGESILLELTCAAGMTEEVSVLYNATGEGLPILPQQQCPHARFTIDVPRDFVGKNVVSVMLRRGDLHADMFSFEVRSDVPPKDIVLDASGEYPPVDGCSSLFTVPKSPIEQSVQVFAVLPDGTKLDLCRGADVRFTTDQPDFRFDSNGHACGITSRREGSFKLTARYFGFRKEWICRAEDLDRHSTPAPASKPASNSPAPPAAGRPRPPGASSRVQAGLSRISIPAFRRDPGKLDHRPMEVGSCRLVEHYTTGYCYVYSLPQLRKVSPYTDVRCEDLEELRNRMEAAIEGGHCN